MMDTLWSDVRLAARSLRRTPGFTATAIVTLTLGIGATSAIFTVMNAALLKPLPYPRPDRVVVLASAANSSQTGQLFLYLRERARSVERVAAQRASNGWNLVAGGAGTYVTALQVSTAYFETLGVAPLLGRGFTPAETAFKGPEAVVISEPLWRRALGGRPDAIGQVVQLGATPHTVVGVMPAGFRSIPEAEVWTPMRTSASDNTLNYRIVARLREGATLADARRELDVLRPGIEREFPRMNVRRLAATTWLPLRDLLGAPMRTPLLLLLAAVGVVLLIACVNVAGLQLARALGRRRELATRAALGGTRARLARHVAVEALLLGLAGAIGGLLVAAWGAPALVALVSADAARLVLSGAAVDVDWRVFAFTLTVALGSSLVFALAPALLSTRVAPRAVLAEGATTTASGRTAFLRRTLAVLQVALASVLLVGAGLLIRTLWNLTATDSGFVASNVLVGRMSLRGTVADGAQLAALLDGGVARIRRLPGVVAVAASNGVPIERPYNAPLDPPAGGRISEVQSIDWRYVTPDYFRVFGIQQVAGRLFDDGDRDGAEPVAVVNEAFARAYFGRSDVVGETVRLLDVFQDPPRRIVGVVADVKAASGTGLSRGFAFSALGLSTAPMLFTPAGQASATLVRGAHEAFAMTWSIQTSGASRGLEREIQLALHAADPRLPFITVEPMSDVVSHDLDIPRFLTTLLAAFAMVAALLAAVGLYGVMASAGSQRVREIGIRMAFGASALRVLRGFMQEGLLVAVAGLGAGIVGAMLLTDLMAAYLFGVTPLDAPTFAAAAVLLLVTAACASLAPAVRAARIDPVRALKTE
jgi:predicted permease